MLFSKKKAIISLHIILLLSLFFFINFLKFPEKWTFTFSNNLIDKYLRSQDIPKEVKGRVFLSDEEIHIASGYLYINGYLPTEYNFQHPPLIKYLFGLSIKLFNTPLPIQILITAATIVLVYSMFLKLSKNPWLSFFSGALFVTDPLVQKYLNSTLLDPGQNFFILLFIYLSLFYPKKSFLQGLSLGLAAASKFWPPVAFFATITLAYRFFVKNNLSKKEIIITGITATIAFTITYLPIFIKGKGVYYFIWFQGKVVKYWLTHSTSNLIGNSLILFLTGYFKSWWGKKTFLRSEDWSLLWPVFLITLLFYAAKRIRNKKIDDLTFISLLPPLYLLYISFQSPFTRYFLIILPFLYFSGVKYIWHNILFKANKIT